MYLKRTATCTTGTPTNVKMINIMNVIHKPSEVSQLLVYRWCRALEANWFVK